MIRNLLAGLLLSASIAGAQAFTYSVSVSPANSGTLTGPTCKNMTAVSGTPIGACTPVPAPGFAFKTWTSTGCDYSNGGSTVPSTAFGLDCNSTIVGNFVATTSTTPPPAAPTCATKPCVITSCTPSPQANATSTVTMMRAVGSAAPAQLATGLPNNCAYADTNVAAGNTYTYSAIAVVNGEPSADSNSFTIAIPAAALTTPAVSIAFSPATADAATAVTATVTVNATGTVALSSGAYSSAAATLTNGVATIQIPGGTLDVGSISISATYTPDAAGASLYNPATATAAIVITPAAPSSLGGAIAKVVGSIPFQMALNTATLFLP